MGRLSQLDSIREGSGVIVGGHGGVWPNMFVKRVDGFVPFEISWAAHDSVVGMEEAAEAVFVMEVDTPGDDHHITAPRKKVLALIVLGG